MEQDKWVPSSSRLARSDALGSCREDRWSSKQNLAYRGPKIFKINGESSNGRTAAFEAVYPGPNPGSPANKNNRSAGLLFLFYLNIDIATGLKE